MDFQRPLNHCLQTTVKYFLNVCYLREYSFRIHLCVSLCVYVCVCVCVYIYKYIYIYTCLCVCVCVCVCVCMYIYIYIYIYIYTRTCVCVCVCVCVCLRTEFDKQLFHFTYQHIMCIHEFLDILITKRKYFIY